MLYQKAIKDYLNNIHPIDDTILDQYLSKWTTYEVPKRTIITAPGETVRYLCFVISGVQKSYYLNNDRQYVIAFTYSPSFSGIPESFLTQTPSKYYLETITDSILMRIPYNQHQHYLDQHRAIETLFRKATEYLLIGIIQRHYELMALDISQRFTEFAKRSPHLFNLVSHKDLASYLNINATNFSKLYNSIKI